MYAALKPALLLTLIVGPLLLLADDKPAPKRYALLVGVNEYDHPQLGKLRYAENDVIQLARILESHRYAVTLMTGSAKEPTLKPTKKNVEASLKAILDTCRKGDLLLVGLAGHGLQFEGQKDAHFCPIDAKPFADETGTLLSLGEVYKRLDKSNAGVKLLLVDACRNDPVAGRGLNADTAPKPPSGVAVLFSCSVGQQAWEHKTLSHGVFFYHVLEGLKGEAADREGEVTFGLLANHVQRAVSRQVPRLIGGGAQQSPNLKADLSGEPPVLVSGLKPTSTQRPAGPAVDLPRILELVKKKTADDAVLETVSQSRLPWVPSVSEAAELAKAGASTSLLNKLRPAGLDGGPPPSSFSAASPLEITDWLAVRRLTHFGPENPVTLWRAVLSADGSRVLYSSNSGMFVMPATPPKGKDKPIPLGASYNSGEFLSISGDGKTVAWATGFNGDVFASTLPFGKENKVQLARGVKPAVVALTAAGDRLFMVSTDAGALYVMPTDGSDLTRLVTTAEVVKATKMDATRDGFLRLSGNHSNAVALATSDDGARVVFAFGNYFDGVVNLMALDVESKTVRPLTNYSREAKGNVNQLGISGDGETIAYYVGSGPDKGILRIVDWQGKERASYRDVAEPWSLQVSGSGDRVAVSPGCRLYSSTGGGWRDPLNFGSLGYQPHALVEPSLITLTRDSHRALVMVYDYRNQAAWPQLSVIDFRPRNLEGLPSVKGIKALPRFLFTDGTTEADLKATVDHSELMSVGAVPVRENVLAVPYAPTFWLKKDKESEVFEGRFQLQKPREVKALPPGPLTLRLIAGVKSLDAVVVEVGGLNAKAP